MKILIIFQFIIFFQSEKFLSYFFIIFKYDKNRFLSYFLVFIIFLKYDNKKNLWGGPSVGFLRKGKKTQKNVYLIQNAPRSRVKKAYLFVKMPWQCRQNDPLRYEKRGKEHEQTLLLKQKHKQFKGEEKNSQLLMILIFLNKTVEGILAKYPTGGLTRGRGPPQD